MTAQLPPSPTELQALPALFLRHGVQQLAAAAVLVAHHAITAVVPHARGLFETVVNMLYVDQDPAGDRAAAYVAYSIASAESDAETTLTGTKTAEVRMALWQAAVGEFPVTDTSAVRACLQASREQVHDTRVARHLEALRNTLPSKVGRTEWSSLLGHANLLARAEALSNAVHYVALYRTLYRVLSHDAHAIGVLGGLVRNDTGEARMMAIDEELTSKAEAVLDAITGLGLSLMDHVVEVHLARDGKLAEATDRIRSAKRSG